MCSVLLLGGSRITAHRSPGPYDRRSAARDLSCSLWGGEVLTACSFGHLSFVMQENTAVEGGSPVAVVGAGAVGTALACRLATCGYPVRAILSRDPSSARALADRVGAVGADEWTALPADVRLVLICVPDDAISSVAEALAAVDHPWAGTLAGHTSGARTSDALRSLSERGAATFSFHPLQTFASGTPPEAFEEIVIGVEGESDAVSAATALARALGARPVVLSGGDKVRYHCAAALASNGLVALMAVVEEVFSTANMDGDVDSVGELVAPLVQQTWANLEAAPPESVLTGPVARGDQATVAAHLDALAEETPQFIPLYAALSTEMTRLAVRSGQLEGEAAEDLLQMLQNALRGSSDGAGPALSH